MCSLFALAGCDRKEWEQTAEEQSGRKLVLCLGIVVSCWDDLGWVLLWEVCAEGAALSSPAETHGYPREKGLPFVRCALDFYTYEKWETPLPGA